MTVVSGPDSGMSLSFAKPRITIGRGPDNDFVLSDGFVSGRHGVVEAAGPEEIIYRDEESRHGSLVVIDDDSQRLEDGEEQVSDPVDHACEIQVGCTLIKLRVAPNTSRNTRMDVPSTPPKLKSNRSGDSVGRARRGEKDKVITQALEPVQSLNRRIESDHERLAILFRLAGELNGRTALDDILQLVVDATFDAFPNANFFAITLASEPEEVGVEKPFFTRVRGDAANDGEEPIISTSIVEHVVRSEESVLFLKDSIGAEITESILEAEITSCLCAPLVGQQSLLGVMEVDTRGQGGVFSRRDLDLFSVLASNVAFAIERAELSNNIVEMFESFVAASVDAIEARDRTTAGHSQRVTRYTMELAEALNHREWGPLGDVELGDEKLKELRYAALLHDFGKIAVEEKVLHKAKRLPEERLRLIEKRFRNIELLTYRKLTREALGADGDDALDAEHIEAKVDAISEELSEAYERIEEIAAAASLTDEQMDWVKSFAERTYTGPDGEEHPFLTDQEVEGLTIQYGTLTDEEWAQIKSHPAHSERFLERIPWSDDLADIPEIAGAHHEKLDGSGYPKGRSADSLPIQVRMLTVADIFDALTASDRPYRDAFSIDKAIAILHEEAEAGKLDPDVVEMFEKEVLPVIRPHIPKQARSTGGQGSEVFETTDEEQADE
jgi:3',5'-cyclic-nucleotide phosphodiesterase